MTETQRITEEVCKRHGITPEYPLADVLIDPQMDHWKKVCRRLDITIGVLLAAAGLCFLFWAFATVATLALQ